VPIGHRTAAGRLRWPRSTPPARWGVLGTDTRGDTVEGLSDLLRQHAVDPEAWYGVWLFADWQDLPPATTDVAAVAAVEFEASLRDPYRQLSRVFHLIGRRAPSPHRCPDAPGWRADPPTGGDGRCRRLGRGRRAFPRRPSS